MNHIYRVVWNRARKAFVVVPEIASLRTAAGGRAIHRAASASASLSRVSRGVFVLSALSSALFMQSVAASGTEVAGGNTRVYNAPNGVQVIDIATVNGAGVSHNRYLHYNVDPSGQVLNNNSAHSGRRFGGHPGPVGAGRCRGQFRRQPQALGRQHHGQPDRQPQQCRFQPQRRR